MSTGATGPCDLLLEGILLDMLHMQGVEVQPAFRHLTFLVCGAEGTCPGQSSQQQPARP